MLFVTCSRRCDSTASLRVKGRWEKETSSLFSYFNLFFIHSFPFLLSAQWVWIGLLWWITLLVLLSACMWINGCRVRMFLLCSPLSSICLSPPFFPKSPPPPHPSFFLSPEPFWTCVLKMYAGTGLCTYSHIGLRSQARNTLSRTA